MFNEFPFPSQRMPVLAQNIVATSQPLAAQAGLDILRRGGNAIDAAVATAIALSVLEPCSNGIGSDAFAILWDGSTIHGFNSSGRSPQQLDLQRLLQLKEMPQLGWDSVTVPGCVALWSTLSERFGQLPFEQLFESAIHYARKGFLVSPITAAAWKSSQQRFKDFPDFQTCFYPQGRGPELGDYYTNEAQAQTLELIARSHGKEFYHGSLAKKIVATAQAAGVEWCLADLQQHTCDEVEVPRIDYGQWSLLEIPPNGQGIAAQIALGILRHFPLKTLGLESVDGLHLQVEAMKLAFADAFRYVADPAWMDKPIAELLNAERLQQRAALIDLTQAQYPQADPLNDHGTVYLTAADASGKMVSLIQSNYHGFGSGIVVPGTGISLQNRGSGFVTIPGHPNCIAPAKRPFHTIIPGFIMCGQEPLCSFGVMGGHMQAQGHVQMYLRMHEQGLNPQATLDAPRWQVQGDNKSLAIEPGFPTAIIEGLMQRGHQIKQDLPASAFGGGQIIQRMARGYCAGSDKRKDGSAVGF